MKTGTKKISLFLFLLISLSLTGCFSPVKYGAKLEQNPTELHYGDLVLTGEVRDRWWEAYGDEALNQFVETVLSENISLQIAYLRLLDAEIALKQAKAGYYPTVSANIGLGYGGNVSEQSMSDPSYSLGASVGYEIDLWGKVRAEAAVSELSMYAAQDSAESAAISLVSNVVTQWFNIQYYKERKALTEQLLELSESYYEIVQQYYQSGQTTGMDVLEQNNQLETLRSTIQTQEMNIRVAERALEILAGGKVRPVVSGNLPQPIDIGGTVDVDALLTRRPDIRSALRSAQQADARVVIAIANRLPTLRLSASLSFRSADITELFKRMIWDLAGNFVASIFDGFKQSTAIDRAKVTYLQQSMAYGVTVMDAVAEVEKALLTLQLREQELTNSQDKLARQTNILDVSRSYYASGLIDYNRILNALKSYISDAQSELDARRSLLLAQLDVFKAMGGGPWIEDVSKAGQEKAKQLFEQLDEDDGNDDKNKE